MAVSGDLIVIGAMTEDSDTPGVNGDGANNRKTDSGAAYIFVRDNGMWKPPVFLKEAWPGSKDLFGSAVAVSGSTVVIGARGEDSEASGINGDQTNNDAPEAGAAFVFATITPPSIASIDRIPGGLLLRMPVSEPMVLGVQYSESLQSGSWLDIGSFTVSEGLASFADSDPARLSRANGFYRAVLR